LSFLPHYVAPIGLLLAASTSFAEIQSPPTRSLAPSQTKQLKNLSLEELGNVEITTYNKAPSKVKNTPAAVYVITSDDIRRSAATSIPEALRLAPGVEVGRLSSTTWAVGIRGLQNNFSKSVLVLIDGRNVYTPLFAGVYWDVQDLPMDDIDRIEVIRGPGGTIWGPNAANGVINIITKDAATTHGVMADTLAGTHAHTIDDL
jgi:iron complex outermembrane receptor protein